jgi:hypothetical protein
MKTLTTHLLGPLAGIAGAGLAFAGLTAANGATADLNPDQSPTGIAAVYAAKRDDIRFGVMLALAGVLLLIVFVSYLSSRIKAGAGGEWIGSAVLAGGVLALAGVLIHVAVLVAATNSAILLAPQSAQTFLVLEWEYGGVLAPAFAALVGAASIGVLKTNLGGLLARIVSWVGVALAAGLAVSGFMGGALVVIALVWIFFLASSLAVHVLTERVAVRRLRLA